MLATLVGHTAYIQYLHTYMPTYWHRNTYIHTYIHSNLPIYITTYNICTHTEHTYVHTVHTVHASNVIYTEMKHNKSKLRQWGKYRNLWYSKRTELAQNSSKDRKLNEAEKSNTWQKQNGTLQIREKNYLRGKTKCSSLDFFVIKGKRSHFDSD